MKHLSIFLLLLSVSFGCSYLRPKQKIASETADAEPAEAVNDSRLTLNNEPNGTLSDLGPLSQRIAGIMNERASNGVFRVSSDEIENDVWVMADRRLPVGRIADLVLAINQNGGRAIIHRENPTETRKNFFDRPNPLLLVVKTESGTVPNYYPSLSYGADPRDYGFYAGFRRITTGEELKAARTRTSSVEISSRR